MEHNQSDDVIFSRVHQVATSVGHAMLTEAKSAVLDCCVPHCVQINVSPILTIIFNRQSMSRYALFFSSSTN